mmetsp:Transcript_96825/g.298493  ORF Transcript_96825/g.298493 Transcript_96825/m.298493 type:complete len:236 (-) Transcript_96825:1884-2591(-)
MTSASLVIPRTSYRFASESNRWSGVYPSSMRRAASIATVKATMRKGPPKISTFGMDRGLHDWSDDGLERPPLLGPFFFPFCSLASFGASWPFQASSTRPTSTSRRKRSITRCRRAARSPCSRSSRSEAPAAACCLRFRPGRSAGTPSAPALLAAAAGGGAAAGRRRQERGRRRGPGRAPGPEAQAAGRRGRLGPGAPGAGRAGGPPAAGDRPLPPARAGGPRARGLEGPGRSEGC